MTDHEHSVRPASRITDHWYSRPGWFPGRLFDTWHLVFDDPAIQELAARCRTAIAGLPGLHPVPNEWLHLTIQGVGWSDELTDNDRDKVVQSVTEHLNDFGEFVIKLGPPLVKGEALVLPATPTRTLQELRNRLRTAIAVALSRPAPIADEQANGFLPHVSVAYAYHDADATPYTAALNTVSPATTGATVRHVAFIRQDRQLAPNWQYCWTYLARVEFVQ
jgi:2'-5' RNA ligase